MIKIQFQTQKHLKNLVSHQVVWQKVCPAHSNIIDKEDGGHIKTLTHQKD